MTGLVLEIRFANLRVLPIDSMCTSFSIDLLTVLAKTSQVIRDHTLSATPDEFKILSSIGRELQKLSDK